ncbi:hypothetical protein [Colwellia hornerae]|uniref:Uncharacterized protein n=1 Tax=Colwellia hornerae TaxID=89402 RepID=A0A5C6QRM6_9GAMM|nr:hypothetical protein [Colwellia hornerae]TWX55670.1 hypothetical protein ESZ28_05720 [Colwellia hornerae]TWX61880.1 hypothetical protein ESZ26_04495 [Colwellia hornerae]TWX71212.1 hypothetical protein ESZ27_02075 [Colwellia hornerae]
MKALILLMAIVMMALVYAEKNIFNVLVQDTNVVKDIRAEEENICIKLAIVNLADEITIRISSKDKDLYRPWFNGSVDLQSKGFRGNDVWSDRLQTQANYVEYWHKGRLVLHLQRAIYAFITPLLQKYL